MECFPEKREAIRTHPEDIDTGSSHFRELILPWGHWCSQVPFWNPLSRLLMPGPCLPCSPASLHQSWDIPGQVATWAGTQAHPPAGWRPQNPLTPSHPETQPHPPEGPGPAPSIQWANTSPKTSGVLQPVIRLSRQVYKYLHYRIPEGEERKGQRTNLNT